MGPVTSEKKMFTAELLRRQKVNDSSGPVSARPAAVGDSGGVSNADLLKAIETLRSDLKALGAVVERAPPPPPSVDRKAEENDILRTEIRALSRAIKDTKAEIVALRPHDADEDRLMAVTHELDAVVRATENATNGILTAAERVDELAQSLRLAAADEAERVIADEIMEKTIQIFESCNFQDLTGQRITKVVNTLKYIEDRINSMIEIWGQESLTEVAPSVVVEKEGEAALLNGPQLEAKAISQDEIDKLFG